MSSSPTRVRAMLYRATCTLPLRIRRQILYARYQRRLLNLRNPRRFTEKVNWRIVFDRSDSLAWTCDKQRMKEKVERIDGLYVPHTYWFGTDVRELAETYLPDRWVLKPNHRSGTVYFGEGQPSDTADLERITSGWLHQAEAVDLGEWAYSRARPGMIAEEHIGGTDAPDDYKFFVFHGQPRVVLVDTGRFGDHRRAFYRIPGWEPIDVVNQYPQAPFRPRPAHLDDMTRIAAEIGGPFDFMRVDLYDTERQGITFGETSPYPGGGLGPFQPPAYDIELGRAWTLPRSLGAST